MPRRRWPTCARDQTSLATGIALQGWSNGGSATLSAMSMTPPGIQAPTSFTGFRAGYRLLPSLRAPGVGSTDGYHPYAPVRVFHGSSRRGSIIFQMQPFRRCQPCGGSNIDIRIYEGASHGFDDPARRRQRIRANAEAVEDAVSRSKFRFPTIAELGRKPINGSCLSEFLLPGSITDFTSAPILVLNQSSVSRRAPLPKRAR